MPNGIVTMRMQATIPKTTYARAIQKPQSTTHRMFSTVRIHQT